MTKLASMFFLRGETFERKNTTFSNLDSWHLEIESGMLEKNRWSEVMKTNLAVFCL